MQMASIDLEFSVLCATAASLGVLHTLVGLDHAIPFVAIGKSRSWGLKRTLLLTLGCGIAHVASSILIGFLAMTLGAEVFDALAIESQRGTLASWFLLIFGLTYGAFGIRRARSHKNHSHSHHHGDGHVHEHTHSHHTDHAHAHTEKAKWPLLSLFVIFALGPCEVLIPVLMVPASAMGWSVALMVALVFSLATLATMMAMVSALFLSANRIRSDWLSHNGQWLAGASIAFSGLLMISGVSP